MLIAERLDGRPSVRLVSPAQYGYKSTKHLCRLDVHTLQAPPPAPRLRGVLFPITPRARVWEGSAMARSPPGSSVRSIAR